MLPSKLGASRVRFQEGSYIIFPILSSPIVIIVEYAHGASFEQVLRKMRNTGVEVAGGGRTGAGGGCVPQQQFIAGRAIPRTRAADETHGYGALR